MSTPDSKSKFTSLVNKAMGEYKHASVHGRDREIVRQTNALLLKAFTKVRSSMKVQLKNRQVASLVEVVSKTDTMLMKTGAKITPLGGGWFDLCSSHWAQHDLYPLLSPIAENLRAQQKKVKA